MPDTLYITTAIAYVNAPPHIGHALEFIQSDAIARYQRLRGKDVYFLTGTDENSLNTVRAAERAGVPVHDFVRENAERFKDLKALQNLSYNDFIRTTEDRHIRGAQKLWQACHKDIYRKVYRGLYCVGCETFYPEKDLIDGCCPVHKTVPEVVDEENYFFRLSAYQDRLRTLIASDRLRVIPQARKNELLSQIDAGLEDFSISRSQARARNWGIAVPDDTSQIMYVWFDALSNYVTALGYADDTPLFHSIWQESGQILHVIGKDIIRFHALYWPAMLLSAGLRVPDAIFAHGFVTAGGVKMSKSLGNVVDPVALIQKYGTDPVRYYLLREIPAMEDGDFTYERLESRYNANLGNSLGNLLHRSVSMVERYRGGELRRVRLEGPESLLSIAAEVGEAYKAQMDRYEFHSAIASLWMLVDRANQYVQTSKPWDLAKDPSQADRLDSVLYETCEALRIIGVLLWPVMPASAEKIWKQIGMTEPLENQRLERALRWGLLPDKTHVQKGEVIFPRLEPT